MNKNIIITKINSLNTNNVKINHLNSSNNYEYKKDFDTFEIEKLLFNFILSVCILKNQYNKNQNIEITKPFFKLVDDFISRCNKNDDFNDNYSISKKKQDAYRDIVLYLQDKTLYVNMVSSCFSLVILITLSMYDKKHLKEIKKPNKTCIEKIISKVNTNVLKCTAFLLNTYDIEHISISFNSLLDGLFLSDNEIIVFNLNNFKSIQSTKKDLFEIDYSLLKVSNMMFLKLYYLCSDDLLEFSLI